MRSGHPSRAVHNIGAFTSMQASIAARAVLECRVIAETGTNTDGQMYDLELALHKLADQLEEKEKREEQKVSGTT